MEGRNEKRKRRKSSKLGRDLRIKRNEERVKEKGGEVGKRERKCKER